MVNIAKKISKFTKREIDYLFKNARRALRSETCTILFAPRQGEFGRILIVASRKVGNAPQRNLIRRRLKSIFYEEKLYDSAVDCAIILQKKATGLSFSEMKDLIVGVYAKVKNRESSTS